MKHLLTLAALLVSSLMFGQEACPNLFDSNGNDAVDIEDFLMVLSLFSDVDADSDGIWDSQDDCMDLEACNYAASPTEPCAYLDVLGECGGGCEGDGDGDGICDDIDTCIGVEDECGVCNGPGPTEVVIEDITILYDSVYAEQIDQWFVFEVGADTTFNIICSHPPGCGSLFFSEASEGSSNNKYLEIYNPGVAGVSLSGYALAHTVNAPATPGNFESWVELPTNAVIAPGAIFKIVHTQAVSELLNNADFTYSSLTNGDDGFGLVFGNPEDFDLLDIIGNWDADPGSGWSVAGTDNATANHTLVRKAFVQSGNGGDWVTSAGTNTEDSEWIVLNQDDWTNLGMHEIEECDTFVSQENTCGDPVGYQGYDYATVLICEQCWFAENLRNENYENGDAIPAGLSSSEWESTSSGAVAVYNEDASNLETYGRLYNWYAVNDARGMCPSGWHVPTDGEWMTMEMALGMSEAEANDTGWRGTDQGTQMKTDYGWSGGGNGTNSIGFSGLPGGFRYYDGLFDNAGSNGFCWSSSPNGSDVWYRFLEFESELVNRAVDANRRYGFSVRCVRDAE